MWYDIRIKKGAHSFGVCGVAADLPQGPRSGRQPTGSVGVACQAALRALSSDAELFRRSALRCSNADALPESRQAWAQVRFLPSDPSHKALPSANSEGETLPFEKIC